jgi:hypothetical protein
VLRRPGARQRLAIEQGAKVAEGSEADPRALLGWKVVADHRV